MVTPQIKADNFYIAAKKEKDALAFRLILVLTTIFLLSVISSYLLINAIRRPLSDLNKMAEKFSHGDYSARSNYQSTNEIGLLARTFNSMAASVEEDLTVKQNLAWIAGLMLKENALEPFCKGFLDALCSKTGSQVAAFYILDPKESRFEHQVSIGLSADHVRPFSAKTSEGDFGIALSTKKIVHLKQIPDDTRFYFPTAFGVFKPKEIITIPILDQDEVIAMISLATIHEFSPIAIKLLDEIWVTLIARVNGVLAFHKLSEFSDRLDMQYKELEEQSNELMMQADELKEYNIELELQKKQLDEANHLKSAFLSNMSHELRTPLNSVIALSGVLTRRLKKLIPEEEYNYLNIIEKNGKHLLSLINDILDLSRIEAGKEELNYSRFTIQNLVKEILDPLEPVINEKNITLINHIGEDLPPIVSDNAKCHHIIQNIISNAIKFTDKGSVEIEANQSNNEVHIHVKDTGIGISADHLPFIFDEFRQADERTSRKYGGTGLGLSIARKYAMMLSGSIEVESQPGKGSVFTFKIPVKPAQNQMDRLVTEYPFSSGLVIGKPGSRSKKVQGRSLLLVEDSEPQIIQLTDILKEEGYEIQVARNGKEALKIIEQRIPDAMILDLMMPEVDGFEVLQKIRNIKETSHIPVLILSAKHVSKQELSFLQGNNIHQLIQKGDIHKEELLKLIQNMVEPSVKTVNGIVKSKPVVIPKGVKATILLVEDNPDNNITVKALLGEKYHIISATDGLDGLEQAKSVVPHLILLDISLPGMDGYTVFDELTKIKELRHIPVIALTARAMKGDRESLLSYGFDDYIAKPIDNEHFIQTINDWLNG